MKLGKRQHDSLKAMARHLGRWYDGCGWQYDTPSGTERIMRTLATKGLVQWTTDPREQWVMTTLGYKQLMMEPPADAPGLRTSDVPAQPVPLVEAEPQQPVKPPTKRVLKMLGFQQRYLWQAATVLRIRGNKELADTLEAEANAVQLEIDGKVAAKVDGPVMDLDDDEPYDDELDDDRPCFCGRAHTAAEHGYDPDKEETS